MKRFLLLLSVIVLASCAQTSKQEENFNAIKDSVLTIHDDMMKDMGVMSSLIQKVEPKIDSTEKGIEYKHASIRLKRAHDRMMGWMHEFNEEFPDLNNKEKTYSDQEYEAQTELMKSHQQKLEKLERQMNQSITNAEDILENK